MSVAAETLSMMTLAELLGRSDVVHMPVPGLSMNSRTLARGDVFLAVAGRSSHGLAFARDALSAGCSAIVFDPQGAPSPLPNLPVPLVAESGLSDRLGELADRFHGQPSSQLRVIGVTGTNGKTTVAWLLGECLQLLGRKAAYSGTLGYGIEEIDDADGMTTPDVVEMHRRIRELADAGAGDLAMEVSSHALDQRRVDGVRFKLAVFTNLSRDHLDYHSDMADYEFAKRRLFTEHAPEHRVINIDSDAGRRIAAACEGPVVTVSMVPDADASVVIRSAEPRSDGFRLAFDSEWGNGAVRLPLYGSFNVENAAVVLASLLVLGIEASEASGVLERIQAPPGRLQAVGAGAPAVVVDYAHTPDALQAALAALRPNCSGELWCVFGCGGDRDRGKRALMASAAERLADRLVVTSDNPRRESPSAIIAEVAAGLARVDDAILIEDRAAAIGWAINHAAANDLVLIAGKGHERVQLIGDERLPFSDVEVAQAIFDRRAEH
ncbi:MAG: UDP-N-acetylmuramoyl-L-alanyl-D-glutamate--2,6-diaminopimelate ligase [Pseudomonadota bacterium]